jgi:hypothetical protein
LRPIAVNAASVGLTTTLRTPGPSAAACTCGLSERRAAAVIGAITTTRSWPFARSTLAADRAPPSM